ncbi:hypothetical protein PVK06_040100 [Gossypium arboreum]|uniref:Uncharacterized protein n=1 Tax=Gossypium arboreum TaxID=29729 RepID=A0ABR0N4J6_GOSAR|nr:hypothetical protein PVK06_040100 [Gossypium arboreum]
MVVRQRWSGGPTVYNRRRDHEGIDQDQEAKIQCPVPFELSKVILRGFLVINFELILFSKPINKLSIANPQLHFPQLLCSQAKRQLVAPPLVLEPIDAPQGLSHRDIEYEMRQRKQSDESPAVATLQTTGLRLSHEDNSQEDKEELEKLVKLLLLEVYSSFLFQGFLKMKLDNRV